MHFSQTKASDGRPSRRPRSSADPAKARSGSSPQPWVKVYIRVFALNSCRFIRKVMDAGRSFLRRRFRLPQEYREQNTPVSWMVDGIADQAEDAVVSVYKRTNSLDYKLGLLVDAMLEQVRKNETDTAEKLIDLMEGVNGAAGQSKPVLTMFAKKEDPSGR